MCGECDATRFTTIKVEDAGKCPLCGQKMTKHIIKEGARYHVHSYSLCHDDFGEFSKTICNTENCEDNHGYGLCVPRTKEYMKELEDMRKSWEKKGFGISGKTKRKFRHLFK
jgi:hypothetical protein